MNMIERVALAMEDADFIYDIIFVGIVDGVHVYRLKYSDGEIVEFCSTEECYKHVAIKRRVTQARAAIEAMREPTDMMITSGTLTSLIARGYGKDRRSQIEDAYRDMIDKAL